mgnify:CR=1 FL=1
MGVGLVMMVCVCVGRVVSNRICALRVGVELRGLECGGVRSGVPTAGYSVSFSTETVFEVVPNFHGSVVSREPLDLTVSTLKPVPLGGTLSDLVYEESLVRCWDRVVVNAKFRDVFSSREQEVRAELETPRRLDYFWSGKYSDRVEGSLLLDKISCESKVVKLLHSPLQNKYQFLDKGILHLFLTVDFKHLENHKNEPNVWTRFTDFFT